MRRRIIVLVASSFLVLAPAATANAASSGTVGVTVTAAAPCVTTSGSFNYGALNFSTNIGPSKSGPTSGPSITNCSGTSESFLANVSNLTGTSVTWTPVVVANPCSQGANKFDLNTDSIGTGSGPYDLTGVDQNVGSLITSTPYFWLSVFTMPCINSSGAGVPMSGTITITATF